MQLWMNQLQFSWFAPPGANRSIKLLTPNLSQLEQLRITFLGRKSELQNSSKQLGTLSPEAQGTRPSH